MQENDSFYGHEQIKDQSMCKLGIPYKSQPKLKPLP
jgi:hypothetical protein